MVLGVALAAGGCQRSSGGASDAAGAVVHGEAVLRGAAKTLDTDVRMGAGTLSIAAAEPNDTIAFEGDFSYPAARLRPHVTYSVAHSQGRLTISQPFYARGARGAPAASRFAWKLRFAPGVPSRMRFVLGASESHISMRSIEVTALAVVGGGGRATIDLTGLRVHDVTGRIEPGLGDVELIVPRNVGVRFVGGAVDTGEVDAPDLIHGDGDLVNPAWAGPGPRIEMNLLRGGGRIRITLADT